MSDTVDECVNEQARRRVEQKLNILLDKVLPDLTERAIDKITARENRAARGRLVPDPLYLRYSPLLCLDLEEVTTWLLTRLVVNQLPDPE